MTGKNKINKIGAKKFSISGTNENRRFLRFEKSKGFFRTFKNVTFLRGDILLELRKDYILNRYVIIAEKRKVRPREFHREEKIAEPKVCYFCPGNEHTTPPEIGRVEYKGKWKMRWFPNKFPFLQKNTKAYGYHEVIVETAEHKKQLWDMGEKDIVGVLKVYALRIKDLEKKKGIKYVSIFKNHGREGGTSILHTHTQVAAMGYVPTLVLDEIRASHKGKKCLYCSIVKKEANSKRKAFENKDFVAFCPYASRFNFEIWIFPKKHVKDINEFNENELLNLSKILKRILLKLKKLNCSYNYYLHYAPGGKDLHFHIEITPRLASWGGFEFSTDTVINSVSPENAARFYRG